jgi:pimeloyl-ACP methyl ester carboxylesterase
MGELMANESHLSIGGVRLEYRWLGPAPGEAATLVLLHEGLGCIAMWKDFPARLAAATGCGVLVYSRQGYGRSDPIALPRPLDYMEREAELVLPEILDAAGIERAILVGHSDGASIATIYAGSFEDHRVRGLVLIAPHFLVEEVSLESIRAAKAAFETGDLRQRLERHHGGNVEGAFWGWNRAWLDPGFRDWNIEDCLAYVRVPILIVQGEADPYGTRRQIDVAQEEAYCPVDVCLLPNCGHAPHLERPDGTLVAVADFIRRLAAIEAEDPLHPPGDGP